MQTVVQELAQLWNSFPPTAQTSFWIPLHLVVMQLEMQPLSLAIPAVKKAGDNTLRFTYEITLFLISSWCVTDRLARIARLYRSLVWWWLVRSLAWRLARFDRIAGLPGLAVACSASKAITKTITTSKAFLFILSSWFVSISLFSIGKIGLFFVPI